jgi:uncharacterized ferritin-like protein (DUF455 family)
VCSSELNEKGWFELCKKFRGNINQYINFNENYQKYYKFKLNTVFTNLFDDKVGYSQSDLEMLTEIYKLLNKNLQINN